MDPRGNDALPSRRRVRPSRRPGSSLGWQERHRRECAASPALIARVAPYLSDSERDALGIVDAVDPTLALDARWARGALVASARLVDPATTATAPLDRNGAVAQVDGGLVRFSRSSARLFRDRLLGVGFVPREEGTFVLDGIERSVRFVRETAPLWTDVPIRLDAHLRSLAQGGARLEIGVRARRSAPPRDAGAETAGAGWFDLELDLFVDGQRQQLTAQELDALLGSGERYVEIGGRPCDASALAEHRELALEVHERRRASLAGILALRDELAEFDRVDLPEEVEQLRERLRAFAGLEETEPPPLATGELRPYQRRGLDFLAFLAHLGFGGMLADDMGLGKTLQVIAHLAWRKVKEGNAPSLVVAPTSVTHAWEIEIARFAPQLRVLRLQSGSDRAQRYGALADVDVVITSYALARLDVESLSRVPFRTLVLDEAQQAKNPESQIARALRRLTAEHRLALTGTPVENSLRDLWTILSFVEPALLGRESEFPPAVRDADRAEETRGRWPRCARVWSRSSCGDGRKTSRRSFPIAPRWSSSASSPSCSGGSIVASSRRRGRDVFEVIEREGVERARLHVLAALTRLRQICAHPGLVVPEYRDDPNASGKFTTFLETVEEEIVAGGHRVSRLQRVRDDAGHHSRPADGGRHGRCAARRIDARPRPPGARGRAFRRRERGRRSSCARSRPAASGLTLTAADYVIIYDPWWNPAAERRAIDRTHRIGQRHQRHRLPSSSRPERSKQKIRTLAARKRALAGKTCWS